MDRLPERIQDKIAPCPMSGCWFWMGWDSGSGYGKVSMEGVACMAHRVVYELLVGPIPDGLILDHRCRVRCCCNPVHLEPVTHQINTLIGEAVLYG